MINNIDTAGFGAALLSGKAAGSEKVDTLGTTFNSTLKQINELQKEAGIMSELFVRGEVTDLHQVMLSGEKARLGMELMLEVRNKLLEGYQQIMRMQI